jgi:hypothetical protein
MNRRETIYIEEGGAEHTEATLKAALAAAGELNVAKVLVASTSGETGVRAAELFKGSGVQVIVVGHQTGFPAAGVQQFKPENLKRIEKLGGAVNLGSDTLTNSIRQRQKLGHSPVSFITQTLTSLKVKVNVEIVCKACDAGLVQAGEHVISVAGSHRGADTAVSFLAADSPNVLDVKPQYFICMPLSRDRADAEYMAKRQAAQ